MSPLDTLDDSYILRKKRDERKEIDDWMQSQIAQIKPEKIDPLEELRSLPSGEYQKKLKEMGLQEEPGLIQPGRDPEKSFVENMVLSLTDPVEWASLAGGGAWQAARMGKSMISGAIDWATLGIPSLAKGIKGFGKGIIGGLGAKAKEATRPISKKGEEALSKILGEVTPEMRVGAEAIKEVTQPTVAKLAESIPSEISTVAEKMSSEINKKIDETSGQIIRLANKWDSIKEKATRGHIAREESIAKGKELGMTVDTIKNLFPGTPMNAEQASALIDVIKPMADDSVKAAQKYLKTRKPEDLHEAFYKFYALMEIDPKRFGVIAEAGRTLSQLSEPISGVNQYLNQFSKVFSELVPEGLTPEYLIHLIAQLETPEQLAIMARHAAKPGSLKAWSQALLEGWTMGLLTGLKTHAVNFTSNTLTALMGPTERALAARLAFGEGPHVVKGEALEMIYGMTHSFMDALSLAGKSFRTGVSQFGLEKAEYIGRKAISAEALNLSGTLGRAVDYLGEATRIPGRALVAADDLFKVINFNANIRALALREGKSQNLTGEGLSNFIENFVKSPPTKAIEFSREYANYMTFTKELDGLALSVQQGIEKHPMLRVIVPFWRTPVDIFKFSLERTPFLNALSGQLRGDILAGGVRRDLAMGKIAEGAMIGTIFYTLARTGYITGSGPEDKNLRKSMIDSKMWQPDSIKVGDQYYGYGRLDPISQFIGSVADLAAISDELDQPRIDQYAMALTLGYMNHMTTKTYLTGITNILEAIKEPDQRGIDYIKRWTGSLVPTLGRHIEQQIDPTLRETQGFFDQIISGVPGWSKTLPPRRDLKGEQIIPEGMVGPDLFSFISKTTEGKDPVWREIVDNKISVSPVPRFMGGPRPPKSTMRQETEMHGIELTSQEYDWVCRMAGNELKIDGKGMWDSLTELIKTPEYKSASGGPEGMKSLMIKSIINKYRDSAFAELRDKNKILNKLITNKEKERIQLLLPQGARP